MKPVENNYKHHKFKVGYYVRILKCTDVLAKGNLQNLFKGVSFIEKVKNTVL